MNRMRAKAVGVQQVKDKSAQTREVYFEHQVIGHAVRVCAVDAATGTEVTISGPVSASQRNLEAVALQKLKYVLSKKAASG